MIPTSKVVDKYYSLARKQEMSLFSHSITYFDIGIYSETRVRVVMVSGLTWGATTAGWLQAEAPE